MNGVLLLRHKRGFDREFNEESSIVLTVIFQSWSSYVVNSTISKNSLAVPKFFVGAGHLISLSWCSLLENTRTRKTVPELFLKIHKIFSGRLLLRFQFKLCTVITREILRY